MYVGEYYRNLKEEIKGVYVFCNIASGNEFHKEASNDNCLRTAAAWVIVNLCFPTSQRFLDGRKGCGSWCFVQLT
ncbi:hypothetical protein L6164_008146 [Bauhinia variegata]|uniref:Uncharacterized protein n=1 Tax=Bauhinia variegata TaxID=167791 RepID=A0ACB9PH62_BAUVA|nr:hypothetical protein L6164_008146 [Bauhinia variegata]